MGQIALDALDQQILQMIADNARVPFLEVARACNVSGAAIHQRIAKLTKMGVIKGTHYQFDPEKMGQLWHTERYWVSLISESQYNHVLLTKMLHEKQVNPDTGKREVPEMMRWLAQFCDEHEHPRSLICLFYTMIVTAVCDVVTPESFLSWYQDTYLALAPK